MTQGGIGVLLLGTGTLVAASCGVRGGPVGPVAMFRGDTTHHGVYQTLPLEHFGGLQWKFQTGGPVRSSAALAGDVVYVGSSDGYLYALDRWTGLELWRFGAGSAITSSPAVSHRLVFVVTRDGTCYAVDARSGALRWSFATGPDVPFPWGYESGDIYTSSPVVAQGTVVFGSGDGHVYALAALDGEVLWRFRTGGRVRSSPAVADGVVYVGGMDGSIYAIDLASAELRWRYDTEGKSLHSVDFGFDRRSIQSSPAVADGTVYVGSRDGHLYAVDATTGFLRWRFDHQVSWVNSSPAVDHGVVYAGSSDARFVQGVRASSGEEIWRLTTAGVVWSSPAVAGGMVYVGDFTGWLYAIDKDTGKLRWRLALGGGIRSSPVVADGMLYVGADDGAVYAVRSGEGMALSRAVYWDEGAVAAASFAHGLTVRAYLEQREYEVLDDTALARFMRDRVADRAPSVVVFSIDHLPATVVGAGGDPGLLRRYLEVGGKVVWLGIPPLLWEPDPATGRRRYAGIDRGATTALLGVDHARANFDPYYAAATPEGERWGMTGWWRSAWAVDPAQVTTVLSRDENGLAASWARAYAGPRGTGFVRLGGLGSSPRDLATVQAVAEYLPRTR